MEGATVYLQPIYFMQIILTLVLIYQYLGVYSLVGALAITVFGPFVVTMTVLESRLQTKHMKKKDERLELVTEIFNNVKVGRAPTALIKLTKWSAAIFVVVFCGPHQQSTRDLATGD